jgi:hypothetical protein
MYCEEPKAPPPDGNEVTSPPSEQSALSVPKPEKNKGSKEKKKTTKKQKSIKKSTLTKSSTIHTDTIPDTSQNSASVSTEFTAKRRNSTLYGMEKTLIEKNRAEDFTRSRNAHSGVRGTPRGLKKAVPGEILRGFKPASKAP